MEVDGMEEDDIPPDGMLAWGWRDIFPLVIEDDEEADDDVLTMLAFVAIMGMELLVVVLIADDEIDCEGMEDEAFE